MSPHSRASPIKTALVSVLPASTSRREPAAGLEFSSPVNSIDFHPLPQRPRPADSPALRRPKSLSLLPLKVSLPFPTPLLKPWLSPGPHSSAFSLLAARTESVSAPSSEAICSSLCTLPSVLLGKILHTFRYMSLAACLRTTFPPSISCPVLTQHYCVVRFNLRHTIARV